MKAISKAKWEVYIYSPGLGERTGIEWLIDTKDNVGVKSDFPSQRNFKSEAAAKKNWEKFAKINGIKRRNWKYV